MKKRLFAILLCLVMIVGLLPAGALAVQDTNTAETHVHSSNETAATAAGNATYLAFTSDVHNQSGNVSANRIKTWLTNVSSALNGAKIEAMGFCGDYASYSYSGADYWTYTKPVMDAVAEMNVTGYYTTGNHELMSRSGGDYNNYSSSNETAKKITKNGLAVNTDDYIIYYFGVDNYNSGDQYTENDKNQLDSFLAGLKDKAVDKAKPIFILTHFPLHNSGSRKTANASAVADVLNQYGADGYHLIYLWGHNHSLSPVDTHYDKFYTPGSTLDVYGSNREIQFTYCAAGCMSDSEYSNSRNVYGKGLVAAVTDDNVNLTYYTENGQANATADVPLKSATPAADQYLVVVKDAGSDFNNKSYALTSAEGEEYYNNSGAYYYYGLNGVAFTENMEPSENMLWTRTEAENGFYLSQGDNYLGASYKVVSNATVSNPTVGKLVLSDTKDVWSLTSGNKLKSSNATTEANDGKDKCLTFGNPGHSNTSSGYPPTFCVRSTSNAQVVELIKYPYETSPSVDPPVDEADIKLTPSTSNPSESKTIAVGETITVQLNNASANSDYNFSVTPTKNGVAQLSSNSVSVAKGGSGTFTITGNANGTVDINITNGSSYNARTAVIHLTVGSGGDTPVVETKTYVPAYQLVAGGEYLIVNGNTDSIRLLSNNNGSVGKVTDDVESDGSIKVSDSTVVWKAVDSSGKLALQNSGKYLTAGSRSLSIADSAQTGWSYSNNQLKRAGSSTYTVYYSNGAFTSTNSSNDGKIYLFVEENTVDPGTAPMQPQAPGENGTYVILVNGKALTATTTDNEGYGNGGDKNYVYTGLAGVDYIDGTTPVTDDMVWTVTKSGSGYIIKNGSNILSATYASTTNPSGARGNLAVGETSDIWTYSNGMLQSTNSTKYLSYENTYDVMTVRSTSNADSDVSFIPVAAAHTHSLTKIDAVAATCTKDGNIEYYTCTCGKIFRDAAAAIEISAADTVVPAAHTIEKVAAVAATCTKDGNIEHWKCTVCGKLFSDQNGEHEIAAASVVVPAAHTIEKVAAVAATCTKDGNIEHWKCTVCGKLFSDKEGEHEITAASVVVPAAHTLVKVAAVAPTETTTGLKEHWKCTVCGKLFLDAEGKTETSIEEVTLPVAGHTHSTTKVAAVEATCTKDGNIEYYSCTCGKYFRDAAATIEIALADTVVPAAHTLEKVAAVAATCTKDGNIEHWKCSVCGKLFSDKDGEHEITAASVVVPATHTIEKVAAVAATCTKDGNIEHWKCTVCGKLFSDKEGEHEITAASVVVPAAHTIEKVAAVAATCTKDGNIEHWKCSVCGKLFSDKEGEHEITAASVVVPAAHTLVKVAAVAPTETTTGLKEHWKCSVCGALFLDEAGTKPTTLEEVTLPKLDPVTEVTYTLTDKLEVGKNYLVVSAYENGTAYALDNTLGAVSVTIADGKITLSNDDVVWSAQNSGSYVGLKNGDDWLSAGSNKIKTTTSALDRTTLYGDYQLTIYKDAGSQSATYYVYYDNGFGASYDDNHKADKVYLFVEGNGTPVYPSVEPTDPPVGETVTYTLTHELEAGKEYLIVNSSADGSAYALLNKVNSSSGSWSQSSNMSGTAVTISDGKIQLANNDAVWTSGTNADGFTFTNGGKWLNATSNGLTTASTADDVATRTWSYAGDQLKLTSDSGSVYVMYYSTNNDYFNTSSSSHQSDNIYLFVKDDGSVTPHTHELVHHDAKAATTTEPGNIEYWECTSCGKLYSDAAATHQISLADTVIPAIGESVVFVPATSLEADKEYLIVNGNTGAVYVVSNEAGSSRQLKGISATVDASGNITLSATDAAKATFTAVSKTSDSGSASFWLKNGNSYLYTDSNNGLRMSAEPTGDNTGKFWHYKADGKNLLWFFKDTASSDGYTDNSNTYKYYLECSNAGIFTDNHASNTPLASTDTPAIYLFVKNDGTAPVHTHVLTAHAAVAATCTAGGNEAYWECTGCGKLFSDAEGKTEISAIPTTAATGHGATELKNAKEATCSAEGYTGDYVCTVCGEVVTAGSTIAKLAHQTQVVNKKDATCTEAGYTGDTVCSVCGEIVSRGSTISALGHTTELRNAKDPTCTEKGYTGDYVCTRCGETIAYGSDIAALGHEWNDGVVTKQPSCTESGERTFTCKHDATHTRTETIDALGHQWSEWKVTVQPTETEAGFESRTCSRCGQSETREVPPIAHKHAMEAVAAVAATCETAGNEAYWHCTGCNKYFSDAEGKNEIEAPVVLPALGHKTEIRGAKDPTCAEKGYTGDEYCSVCGKLLNKGEDIPALGHKTIVQGKKDATCTEAGYTGDEVCTVCGETVKKGEVIPTTGHKWGDWQVTVPATEDAEGVETRVCSVCGEKETRTIAPIGHTHNMTKVDEVPATCEKDGTEAYWQCSGCGKLFADAEGNTEIQAPVVIEAPGHTLVKHDAVAPTETEAGNIEYWECSVCHKLFSDKDGKTEIKLEDTILDPTGKQPCDGGANCPSIKLTDVDRSATSFYHHAVDWAYVNDIVKGVDDTHFGPKTSCTREMMVTLLWRMNGSPEPKSMVSPFADVTNPDYYSYKAILWAAENGITKGTDEAKKLFSPKDNVTREQVVTLLWRLKGSETVEGAMQFTDVKEGRYSYEAVKWAVQEGITTGRSASSFAPGENCTRAEIVTFLWRFSGSPMV